MLRYERAGETKRRLGQRRIEVFSPKIKRRLTLFSWDSLDAWLLLEADPTVRACCERPAYVDGEAGRVLDFWVDHGGHSRFSVLSSGDTESESLPRTEHGVSLLLVLRRPDTIAFAMRIQNWAQIVHRTGSAFCGIQSPVSREILSPAWRSRTAWGESKPHSIPSTSASCAPHCLICLPTAGWSRPKSILRRSGWIPFSSDQFHDAPCLRGLGYLPVADYRLQCLDEEARDRYQQRATAIEHYAIGAPIEEVEKKTKLDLRVLYRPMRGFLAADDDGDCWRAYRF
jgi:hypothetical protein